MITVPAQDLEAALPRVIAEAQQAAIKRYVHVWLGRYLTSHIRRTDVVAHHAKDGRFVLMAPETPAEQTGEMLRRLSSQAATEFGVDLHYSIADFPSQALTSDELLSHVAEHLAAAPEPSTLSLERAKADVSPVASADL
jgi:hypothetical protein